jgi:DNA-binding HxlR family transcriptional regulator
METQSNLVAHCGDSCADSLKAVKDSLYVLSGKWKLPLILTLSTGPQRFKDIQRSLGEITPKILSKELRELEMNAFVERKVFSTKPVTILYKITPYSRSLDNVLMALKDWGIQHRQRIMHQIPDAANDK